MNLMHLLFGMGIKHFHVKERLPLFKLWTMVQRRTAGSHTAQALDLIEGLVVLRKMGVEPPHNRGRYL